MFQWLLALSLSAHDTDAFSYCASYSSSLSLSLVISSVRRLFVLHECWLATIYHRVDCVMLFLKEQATWLHRVLYIQLSQLLYPCVQCHQIQCHRYSVHSESSTDKYQPILWLHSHGYIHLCSGWVDESLCTCVSLICVCSHTGYLIGLICGYLTVECDLHIQLNDVWSYIKWYSIVHLTVSLQVALNIVYNVFNVIPKPLVFVVPIVSRITLAIACSVGFCSLCALFVRYTEIVEKQTVNIEHTTVSKEEQFQLSFVKGISRLTFSWFLTNLLVIRFLFFSSRTPLTSTVISIVSLLSLSVAFIPHIALPVFSSITYPLLSCAPSVVPSLRVMSH